MIDSYFHFLAVVTRQRAGLSSATKHTTSRCLGEHSVLIVGSQFVLLPERGYVINNLIPLMGIELITIAFTLIQ